MTVAFWTPRLVDQHLVQAFRVLPGQGVYSTGGAFRMPDSPAAAEAFSWAPRFLRDAPRPRIFLYTWAHCRAHDRSWSDRCREMRWPRSTAELGRRRAAQLIADGLNAVAAHTGGVALP